MEDQPWSLCRKGPSVPPFLCRGKDNQELLWTQGQATTAYARGRGAARKGSPNIPWQQRRTLPAAENRIAPAVPPCQECSQRDTRPAHPTASQHLPAITQAKPKSTHCSRCCPTPQWRVHLNHNPESWEPPAEHSSQPLPRISVFPAGDGRKALSGLTGTSKHLAWSLEHSVGLAHKQECL